MTTSSTSEKADIYKIFNLSVTEQGYYRPRVISFLLQYIDSKFLLFMTKVYPQWGARLIGYYFSILMIILASFYLTTVLFPKNNFWFKLLLAMMPLTWLNMHWTLLVTLRSGKLLCVAGVIYIFTIFIKAEKRDFNVLHGNTLLFYVIMFNLFCLVDEQCISMLLLFTCCSLFYVLIDKNIHTFVLYGGCALALYFVQYHTFLKSVFSQFTPNFSSTHPHHLSLLLENFTWNMVWKSIKIYGYLIVKNFSFLLIFFLFALIKCVHSKKNYVLLNSGMFIVGGIISVVGLGLIHPPIINLPELKISMYFLPTIAIFYCLFLYLLKESSYNNYYQFILAIFIAGVSLNNITQFDKITNVIKTGHLSSYISLSNILTESMTFRTACDEKIKGLDNLIPDVSIPHFCSTFGPRQTKRSPASS